MPRAEANGLHMMICSLLQSVGPQQWHSLYSNSRVQVLEYRAFVPDEQESTRTMGDLGQVGRRKLRKASRIYRNRFQEAISKATRLAISGDSAVESTLTSGLGSHVPETMIGLLKLKEQDLHYKLNEEAEKLTRAIGYVKQPRLAVITNLAAGPAATTPPALTSAPTPSKP